MQTSKGKEPANGSVGSSGDVIVASARAAARQRKGLPYYLEEEPQPVQKGVGYGADDHREETAAVHSSRGAREGKLDTPFSGAMDKHAVETPFLTTDHFVLFRNLWFFIWLKAIGSFDSGAFSAALGAENGISEEWLITTTQQGTLTSSVFLGNVLGCLVAGHLFLQYNEKRVLCLALVLHAIMTFMFASFPVYDMALVNRFFIGFTLAFMVVYTSVWVDEFAPKDRQSVWMAAHNAGVPLGIIVGYLLGAYFPSYTSLGWECAFYLKCVLMVPTIAYLARAQSRWINTAKRACNKDSSPETVTAPPPVMSLITSSKADRGAAHSAPAVPSSSMPRNPVVLAKQMLGTLRQSGISLWDTLQPLFSNTIYMCSVLSMCSLYFVATGLQNFITPYLREEPFQASMRTLIVGFMCSVITAPVLGVIAGGVLLDRFGGYKGNLLRVSAFVLFWGAAAATFSIVAIFLTSTLPFLVVMSIVLFCGGAIIPPGAGLTMASLPDSLRSVGAALAQTMYNLLGNFSGPLVCGIVADKTGQLWHGIMTLLLSSALGLLPAGIILAVALRQRHEGAHLVPTSDGYCEVENSNVNRDTQRGVQRVMVTEIEMAPLVAGPLVASSPTVIPGEP